MSTQSSFLIPPANDGICRIAPYQPGKPIDELKRELGLDDVIKLASNENPLGCSPKAKAAIQQAIEEVGRYPDGNGFALKQQISQQFAVEMNQITLGNGSNDILELVARTFVAAQDEVIYSQHAFAVYALATQAVGAIGVEVPAKNFGHDLAAMANAVTDKTRVIFIANPNNPTGTWFEEGEFSQFMQQIPAKVLVVLDEAYVEYFPENFNSLKFLAQYPNLLISRTLSKAFGLASLRVGFGLASSEVTNLLNRVRQPFNVSSFALAAAVAALKDTDFIEQSRELNKQGMAQLEQGFARLGLHWIASRANFIAVDVQRDGGQVFAALLKKGVIVRPVGGGYAMPRHIRVSIGLPEENARFLDALAQVLAEIPATEAA
ncbi:histidinol-phosphate transaminase [Alkanindiges illinoisensis]|uniref:Histidinol-phosphate aminotransferase n=1 Tax=Alkanindiges illinoisensis TaxID=197183 RepID=A0A4Y7XFB6_9GAMM|nr:histidinol-phosphate transaminase [Alkanindiges illinoisensis]TEU30519.1 histidinol-phosphate transaminase [Alkanindiges illinoisensis]